MQSTMATPNPKNLFMVFSRTPMKYGASTVPGVSASPVSKTTTQSTVYQSRHGRGAAGVTPELCTVVLICKRRLRGAEWQRMRLRDQLVQDGDRLFRGRSYLPLILLPI